MQVYSALLLDKRLKLFIYIVDNYMYHLYNILKQSNNVLAALFEECPEPAVAGHGSFWQKLLKHEEMLRSLGTSARSGFIYIWCSSEYLK